ncbi:Utp11-domain-containing protein [Violaceomyces palustris]|uniref:Utp11-domain-containing protein n=1 Tax=Violaceomyces palustris TaxID=1673888 RepID=A0ACD0NZL8_9BASI|nr:Utp11-domain-containing protein [Violaceomyces palustris]
MTLRNIVQRRNHKERSQPLNRAKLGLLEKHKDYVQRAKDHHSKRDRIKRLKEKAADRNKDEFYFGMINSRTEKGVHIQDRGNQAMDNDVVALLKTQDAGYVRAQIMAEKKRIAGLVSRIAPSVPGMRAEWLEEKEGRKQTLQAAGLLISEPKKGKGKAKATEEWYDMDEDLGQGRSSGSNEIVGGMGQKTVWKDDIDQVQAYQPSTWVDDDTMAGEDEEDSLGVKTSQRLEDEKARKASRRAGEKHLGYLVSELKSRQDRLAVLKSASEKLGIVRALMTTKGGYLNKAKKVDGIKDAVAQGKVTSNGLALPGNEDDDDDDSQGGGQQKKSYKWSKERRR